SLPNGNEGTIYCVVGNSGSKDDDASLQYPAHYAGDACNTCVGSFILDVHGDTLRGRYLKASGAIGDDFTIYKIGGTTDVPEKFSTLTDLEVFPSPFDRKLSLRFSSSSADDVKITLFDLSGKRQHVLHEGNGQPGTRDFEFDVAPLNLAAGTYVLKVQSGDDALQQTVVKVKADR
ncbi:MAG: T9SS type A sorting domain-containing protein, partial [Bacteroidota bacterium]